MSDPIATPTDLADLVDYQPGSVVSRVLMRNRGGVMTLFAFAEGEGLTGAFKMLLTLLKEPR